MLKNIESNAYVLDYYGLFSFQVFVSSETEAANFLELYHKKLSPFLKLKAGVHEGASYVIRLKSGVPNQSTFDGWAAITFFNPLTDNAISDFGQGLVKVDSSSRRSIFNPGSGSLIEINLNEIALFYKSTLSFNKDFQRVLKQLIVTEVENRGGAILHASAVTYRDKAVCFIGEKGQGKTTSLLSALQIPEVKYITNDRLPVLPSGDDFKVYGWFEEVRLVIPGSDKKNVVDVASVAPAASIQTTPAKLHKIIFPASKSLRSPLNEIVEAQLLSPVDDQRPKWLGFSDPKSFPLHQFLKNVDKISIAWNYSDLELLSIRIQEVLFEKK